MATKEDVIENQTQKIQALIQGIQRADPKLYQILTMIADQQNELINKVSPVIDFVSRTSLPGIVPLPPTDLIYKVLTLAIRLSWTAPIDGGLLSYEVRQGVDWDSASFVVRTSSTSVDIEPIQGQNLQYLIKSITPEGVYSNTASSILVSIASPGAVSIDGQVIDNNVLLKWTVSLSTLRIDYYELKKGGELVGKHTGTFAMIQEVISGDYIYSITPVDIVGNRGTESFITLRVNQPPDYVLTASQTSNFSGTKIQVKVIFDPTIV